MQTDRQKASLLPRVGSREFNELDFKQQLFILNLCLYDKDKYFSITGARDADDDLAYVGTSVENILKLKTKPEVTSQLPLSFVEGCWTAYLAYFDPDWYRGQLSPLEALDLEHRRVLGIQMFNFPLLSLDRISRRMLSWLVGYLSERKGLNDIFYYLVRMVASVKHISGENMEKEILGTIADKKKIERLMTEVWNDGILAFDKLATVDSVNEKYPVLEPNDALTYLVEDETLAPCSLIKVYQNIGFIPMIPAELYLKNKFKIKGWDFLCA